MSANWGDVTLGALVTLFFAACALVIAGSRIRRAEEELFPDTSPRAPIEGRWCSNSGCQGLLKYQRAREVDKETGAISYLTFLSCWRCGDRLLLHTEPDYTRSRERMEED
jgi:hypothetical protein